MVTNQMPAAVTASLTDITPSERFFFESNGYLVLENFLSDEHVARLQVALDRVITQRRAQQQVAIPHTGMTRLVGARSTRIFYILDDDPLFLELLDWPAMMTYVRALLNPKPHHHASDAIVEYATDMVERGPGWHLDGHDNGYRNLGHPIPLLQLKLGYYLTDMREPGQGNLTIIPSSHKAAIEPAPADLKRRDLFPGALEVCAPAGSAILFHNALWHTAGIFRKPESRRVILYYAYEHPWMVASQEHWSYPNAFYNERLSPEQRKLFHGFVFDPPEARWG
ncbi:MAG: phytanoyl-CoA dioxygenase family protein [Caldilineaceae bacterium]|nr:phytanoyl-CoA dioxygenase family protein [Caldilineaceae bacterium]